MKPQGRNQIVRELLRKAAAEEQKQREATARRLLRLEEKKA